MKRIFIKILFFFSKLLARRSKYVSQNCKKDEVIKLTKKQKKLNIIVSSKRAKGGLDHDTKPDQVYGSSTSTDERQS